jgi:hypothetical protein
MFQVYTAPSAAFARLKEKPVWLLPLILAIVANLAVVFVSTRYIDWTEQRQVAIDKMRERNMTEEQIQQATEGMDKFYGNSFMRFGLPLISSLLMSIIGVLFYTVVYNVSLPLLGVTGNFKRTLAVVTTAGLVSLPNAAVRIVLVLLKKSAEVTTSLLLAAPGLKSGFLAALLGRLDVFAVWQLILTAIGLKVVFDVRGSRSYWLVFGLWLVLTLIMAALGARLMVAGR